MALTAAHCAKTLVIASAMGSPALTHCARLLVPGMIECSARMAALEGEPSETCVQIVAEIWKAFAALFTSASEEHSKFPIFASCRPDLTSSLFCRTTCTGRSAAYNVVVARSGTVAAANAARANDHPGVVLRYSVAAGVQRGHDEATCGAEGDAGDVGAAGTRREEGYINGSAQAADFSAVVLRQFKGIIM